MKNSSINWTHHTFNPWEGCTKLSQGCYNCYAKKRDDRQLTERVSHWGPEAPRRPMSETKWREPLTWNREAEREGVRRRVFCGSLCDWADAEAPTGLRDRLWELIRKTPALDWLLLSKRANRIENCLPSDWGTGYRNVWLGVTVENRAQGLPRIEILRKIPAVCHFLSSEPLLEDLGEIDLTGIDWVITGGESGPGARPFSVAWARSIVKQCQAQGTAPWVKQLGARPIGEDGNQIQIFTDKNGRRDLSAHDWDKWPNSILDLKLRELPTPGPSSIETTAPDPSVGSALATLELVTISA